MDRATSPLPWTSALPRRVAGWLDAHARRARAAAARALADGLWYPFEELPSSVLWGIRLDRQRYEEDRGLYRKRPGA
jgi:hypothetical protein